MWEWDEGMKQSHQITRQGGSMPKTLLSKPLLLGDVAPDFTADSTMGKISFYEWLGNNWCAFFSHPRDFTPVCTTELGKLAKMKPDFDKRHVKIMTISTDSLQNHFNWIRDIEETQNVKLNYPMLADETHEIAEKYGMIHPHMSETTTVRSVFIIDPLKKIRLMITYPPSTGRNFNEILRAIDSLQLTDNNLVATPADWQLGEDCVILPSVTDPKILKERFPKGWKELKPYLRMTPQPTKK